MSDMQTKEINKDQSSHLEGSDPVLSRKARTWLIIASLGGGLLAASGTLDRRDFNPDTLPETVVARINTRNLPLDDYARAVEGLASDKRNPLTNEDRLYILNRLIDEELLIQRGIKIGLLDSDPTVRKAISAAMIESVVTEASTVKPTTVELKTFYDENKAFFMQPGRLWVRQIYFSSSSPNPYSRALKAVEAMQAGLNFEEALKQFGDEPILQIPDGLLPPQKLREYIGPTLLQFALTMQPNDVSNPLSSGDSYRILQMVDVQKEEVADFETIRPQVEAEFRRRAGDKALRDYLDDLHKSADIVYAPWAIKELQAGKSK